jgi:tetratricopeptide (TPR) repeat protein
MEENPRLFQLDLVLTNDTDPDLRQLTDYIREESFPDVKGWYRLGVVLLKMGQPDKAQQVYEIILEQTANEREKAPIYHHLGLAKDKQGEYQEAIIFYKKALEIDQKSLPPNHPDLGMSYNNIGVWSITTWASIQKHFRITKKHLKLNNTSCL